MDLPSLFEDGAEILVSEESNDYRPEMDWLAAELGEKFTVHQAEKWRLVNASVIVSSSCSIGIYSSDSRIGAKW
jgi:hypothetical protein